MDATTPIDIRKIIELSNANRNSPENVGKRTMHPSDREVLAFCELAVRCATEIVGSTALEIWSGSPLMSESLEISSGSPLNSKSRLSSSSFTTSQRLLYGDIGDIWRDIGGEDGTPVLAPLNCRICGVHPLSSLMPQDLRTSASPSKCPYCAIAD